MRLQPHISLEMAPLRVLRGCTLVLALFSVALADDNAWEDAGASATEGGTGAGQAEQNAVPDRNAAPKRNKPDRRPYVGVRGPAVADPKNMFCGFAEDDNADCYARLGVGRYNASDREIKKAYRSLSLAVHPDKDPSNEAKLKFQAYTRARDILVKPEERRKLDHLLEHPGDYMKMYYSGVVSSYAPKTSLPGLLLTLLVFASVICPLLQRQQYNMMKDGMVRAALAGSTRDPALVEFKRQAVALLAKREKDQGGGRAAKLEKRSSKGSGKAGKDAALTPVLEELIEAHLDEHGPPPGGWKKPTAADVPIFRIVNFVRSRLQGGKVADESGAVKNE